MTVAWCYDGVKVQEAKARNFRIPAPLSGPALGNSLRLRALMEEQHKTEIAARLRQLRDDSEETNRSIADYCGVGERTVAGWLSPSHPAGLSYKNAKKVAELFEADVDWIWRGRGKGETPDVMGTLASEAIAADLNELRDGLADALELLADVAARQVEADASQLEADATEAEPQQHEQERVRRLAGVRRRAERLRRRAADG